MNPLEDDMDIELTNRTLRRAAMALMIEENEILDEQDAAEGPGEENIDPALEAMDAFLAGLVEGFLAEHDTEEEDAWEILWAFIDDMGEQGTLPAFPEDGATAEDMNGWIAKAKEIGAAAKFASWVEENVEFE